MLIPLKLLKKYVKINVSDEEFVHQFSLKSAEVDSFKQFCGVKGLKIGKIVAIKDHPDSNHLHITTVDTKDEVEDIVCGAPNVLVGKKVIVAKNGVELPMGVMKKAVIRGVESNGMNCSLEELGIDNKFQGYDGIFYLDDELPIGDDPIKHLNLDDYVLEIKLTPNRQDLLSIIGVAYETKAILNTEINLSFEKPLKNGDKSDIKVKTLTDNCRAYHSSVVKNVKIKESPAWLKGALMMMNIRPINNVVDITNYVLMVTGQPLHAFDYDKIKTKEIVVKMAQDGEKFTTLDEKERTLTKDDIVITDGIKPICLAGVMGGLNTEVSSSTTNIFLEAADFSAERIKNTSKRLNLQSESSLRFEKGINPELTKYALELAQKLLFDLAEGEISKEAPSFDNRNLSSREVSVSLQKINEVIGRTYSVDEVKRVFSSLSFEYKLENDLFTVYIPRRRPDITQYQDLIEEVVRIIGYDKIETAISKSSEQGFLSPFQQYIRKIRHTLSFLLNEVRTYSLTTKEKATYFDNEDKEVIEIINPLLDDRYALRHSLLPSILDCMKYNKNRKNEDCFFFEIGKSYNKNGEKQLLSGALSGIISSSKWQKQVEKVDFYYLKGLVEHLFNNLFVKNYRFELKEKPLKGMHPGVSLSIILGKEEIGFFGKIHPETEKFFDLDDVYVFEIDLDKLFLMSHPLKTVKEISKYPTVERDLALVMDENMTYKELETEIQRVAKRQLASIDVFDLYQGESIGKGKKQIAVHLVFSDFDKTLSTIEVDQQVEKILSHLKNFDVGIRV